MGKVLNINFPLDELIDGIPGLMLTRETAEISGLSCDSRQTVAGDLFFALPGVDCDGEAYVTAAIAAGAVAVVLSRQPKIDYTVPVVVAKNIRQSMAHVAQRFYGDPSADMLVIGVTGTNGKTTTSYLLESILKRAGYRPAIFGTVDYRYAETKIPATHTTPESIRLLKNIAEFRSAGADALVLEVSSHALEQHRVDGIHFDVAIFTNLTPEHLDYHGDMDSYFASKARLFDLAPARGGVINLDDSYGVWLKEQHPDARSFSRLQKADIGLESIVANADGLQAQLIFGGDRLAFSSPLVGEFNQSNILAAAAAAHCARIAPEDIVAGIGNAPQVPGRLERIENNRQVLALVDYAHSSDALHQVLSALSGIAAERRITLVGCGGDRDPKKRPLMAATAVRSSDLAILTSDNPRSEDPLEILEQMRVGALEAGAELNCARALSGETGFVIIPERRAAIEFAARLARAGDLLLVAGKGHEDYQILGNQKIHFDDREELRRAFACDVAREGSQL